MSRRVRRFQFWLLRLGVVETRKSPESGYGGEVDPPAALSYCYGQEADENTADIPVRTRLCGTVGCACAWMDLCVGGKRACRGFGTVEEVETSLQRY